MRKKLVALLLLAAPVFVACRTTTTLQGAGPSGGGATSPRVAAESFLAAAREQNLGAMSAIWGTAEGPARATIEKNELERRQLVMMCHLRHDSHRIVDEAPLPRGLRQIVVELTSGSLTRRTNLEAVPTRNGAWYIQSVDLEPLRDICANRR